MSKTFKVLFIIGAALIVLGSLLFVTVFAMSGWNFSEISDGKYETNVYTFAEDIKIKDIIINIDTADVNIIPTSSGETKVECYESDKDTHTVYVMDDGALNVSLNDREWYENISLFSFDSPKITIYLPVKEYGKLSIKGHTGELNVSKEFKFESINISVSTGDVKCYASAFGNVNISASTGDILISDTSAKSVNLKVSTGDVSASSLLCSEGFSLKVSTGKATLSDISCADFTTSGDTGDLNMKNVLVNGRMYVERSTGEVKLDRCDAKDIEIKTSTGDVSGSVRTEKTFFADSDTGNVSTPQTVSEQICKITCSTGDISITVVP